MKKFLWRIVYLVNALLMTTCLLKADGFVIGTLVHTQQGLKPIEQCKIDDNIITKEQCGLSVRSITHTIPSTTNFYVKIKCDQDCIYAAHDQRFYVINKNRWIKACELQPLDDLLSLNKSVTVCAIEIIHEQQQVYALSVQTNHTFCVGEHGIIAHNVEPASTATIIVPLAITCPPAAVAVAIGETIAFGVAGFIMYRAHKKLQKSKKKLDGCFSLDDRSAESKPNGCYTSDISVMDPIIGCGIVENQTKVIEVIPYEKPEGMNDVCAFPAAIIEQPILCASAAENDCEENKQYPGPWYNRTEDWIDEHPFGQTIKKSLERSKYKNQGKRAFRVIKNIENCDGFKKGDFIVVDAMHKDHLEVFDKRGKWVGVSNFDGTKNNDKTKQGEKEPRGELE